MNDADLERLLADRPRPEPPASLGPRVLAAARDASRSVSPAPSRPERLLSWAPLAAAVLLAVNLSMSVSTNTDWRLTADIEPDRSTATTNELRALAPDLPEAELRRQTLLTRAAAGLAPSAALSPYRNPEELDRWDVR